jgi:hypothetical protein
MPRKRNTDPSAISDRFYVRVPLDEGARIRSYALSSGMFQADFLSAAVVIGSRYLARSFSPLEHVSPAMWESFGAGMARELGQDPEKLAASLKEVMSALSPDALDALDQAQAS